jgi:ABC-type spermidine/putrescine transport system permease subunit I
MIIGINHIDLKKNTLLLILPFVLFYLCFYIAPLVILISYNFESKAGIISFQQVASNQLYWLVILKTIVICILATLATIFVSVPLAYTIVFGRSFIKKLTTSAVIVPIVMNPLIMILGWTFLFRKSGLIMSIMNLLGVHQILFTPIAVIVGIMYIGLPFMVFILTSTMQKINKNLIYGSFSLGANRIQTFWNIIFPLSYNGFFIGALFVFISAVGYFIVPTLLGGGKVLFISVLINEYVNETMNWNLAAALSLLLIFLVFFLVVITQKSLGTFFSKNVFDEY